eukprot:gnl/TRDRNA2_/TRDRNA2_163497_c0_seq7.p1 gnl/TRDRNA2_/TRDRNA2_163497_c0~~gnl/TRDRNA2_/TRDRNA2_163497_c0_seq7.p1  ORF type:complete len:320 (+),score=17.34 gnl/TRDRNA2_/TRDRNA2_163497_c0_seq7:47-1006(+)
MAIPSLLLATFVTVWSLPLNSDLHAQTNVDFICNKNTEGGERLLLIGDVQARLGSTALLQLLSSSPHLTNLCSANVWQCEGFKIVKEKHKIGTNPLPLVEKYWNLSRYILYDKQFPDEIKYSNGMLNEMNETIQFSSTMMSATEIRDLPPRMRDFGISRVRVAYLMMWKPLCMIGKWGKERAGSIIQLANQHEILKADGVPVVVFKYSDFLWRTDALALKIIERLPCLGPLDTDYVESKVARHVNNMSTKAFGKSVSPDHYGYDDRTDTCYEETTYKGEFYMYHDTWGTRVTTRVFETVDGADIKAAETYLRSVSLSIV